MEATKPVQQAFGSPGGKSYLAPRIAAIIPPHKTYVEPFAGAAAVYFRKEPSQKEILSDKDSEIAFAFRFLRDMTPEQLEGLKRYKWVKHKAIYDRLKASKPKNDVERFYRFYYLRRASFGKGGGSFSTYDEGESVDMERVMARLWRVHGRLQGTKVHSTDATSLISKYDSPDTFFYLDPPYPNRAFIGQTFKDWTEKDLQQLIGKLKGIKGKFALSLGTEHTKFIPKGWHVNRVKVWRRIPSGDGEFNQTYQYEIIATNYNPTKQPRVEFTPAKLPEAKMRLRNQRREPARMVRPGIAYTDGKGQRLSRRSHRHWRRVAFA